MMKTGPEKTNVSAFKGFGFGLSSTSRAGAPTVARPPAARNAGAGIQAAANLLAGGASSSRGASKKAPNSGVSALFRESMKDEEAIGKAKGLPSFAKPTVEAIKAQREAEALAAADPSVFQYDEVIDSIKESDGRGMGSQAVRSDALTQKKRVGLTVMDGSDQVKVGAQRAAKYVDKVIVATDRRRVEQQIVEDKLLKKDKDKDKDCEVFVTGGYKEELKARKKFEEELERQDRIDEMKAVERMENGIVGFADFNRNLLNGGFASSRGGELIKEQTAPKEALTAEELETQRVERKTETKEDSKEEAKEEAKDEIKEETNGDDDSAGVGVADASEEPAVKKRRLEEEAASRAEKSMSARERYLARKKAATEQAQMA